jgi:DeoR/GlpR family transcriptional regulator of sugar metabolism
MSKNEVSSTTVAQDLLPEERRKIIRRLLQGNGSIRTTEIAKQLKVNPVTVRRDLREMMNEEEDIRLVHGGAMIASPAQPVTTINDLTSKRTKNIEAKKQIAKKAVNLINDGDIIALPSGSTVELIIGNLPQDFQSLTLVTFSLNVAYMAARLPYIELIVPGGILRRSSQAFIGQHALNFISTLRIDKGFFGAQAVDVNSGFTESNLAEANINRELLKVCTHRYCAADSSKFGRVALGQICDLDEFDGLIVDDYVPETIRSWASATGVPLI